MKCLALSPPFCFRKGILHRAHINSNRTNTKETTKRESWLYKHNQTTGRVRSLRVLMKREYLFISPIALFADPKPTVSISTKAANKIILENNTELSGTISSHKFKIVGISKTAGMAINDKRINENLLSNSEYLNIISLLPAPSAFVN